MDTHEKRYLMEIGGAMAVYTALVPVSIWLLNGHERSPMRYLFALLPVIPSAFAMLAAIRFFRGLDELQRRIQFEAIAFSFLGTSVFCLNWGFLEKVGVPRVDIILVMLVLMVLYIAGLFIARRRYR